MSGENTGVSQTVYENENIKKNSFSVHFLIDEQSRNAYIGFQKAGMDLLKTRGLKKMTKIEAVAYASKAEQGRPGHKLSEHAWHQLLVGIMYTNGEPNKDGIHKYCDALIEASQEI